MPQACAWLGPGMAFSRLAAARPAGGSDCLRSRLRLRLCLRLAQFVGIVRPACEQLREGGYWADYIDPASGLPVLTKSNTVYSEVDGFQLLRHFRVMNAGSCKVLVHPEWGTQLFPASMFSSAPPAEIARVLTEAAAGAAGEAAAGT